MAIKADQALSRDQLLDLILDTGAATRYVQDVWRNATPDDMWDLLYHLGTVLGIVQDVIKERRLSVPFYQAQLGSQMEAATVTLGNLKRALDEYFWPLTNDAIAQSPFVATQEWIDAVRNPVVFGLYPGKEERQIPFASEPFILLTTVLERADDFSGRLAGEDLPHYVFEEVKHRARWVKEKAKDAAEAVTNWIPWVVGGALAFLFLSTRK